MPAAITDKISPTFNTANPNVARVTVGRTALATTLTCDNLAGWPTVAAVHFSTYKIDTSNKVIPGTQIDWKGIVSGNTIGTLTRMAGATDAGSAIGDVVEMNPTGYWGKDLYDWGIAQHNQDGTHKSLTTDTLTTTGNVTIGGSLTEAGAVHSTMRAETVFDHINSGCVWSGDAYASTRNASCTAGVVYLSGKRLTVAAVTTRSFTASKDVYCDLKDNGDGTAVWVYYDNTTNAASPSFATTTGTLRGAIIVVGASNIAAATSVNQGQETMVLPIISSVPMTKTDSLGNLICPRDPNRKVLGYRQLITGVGSISITTTLLTGLTTNVITNGRPIKVTVFAQNISNTSAAAWFLDLYNALTITGSPVQTAQAYMPTIGTGHSGTLIYQFTPAAGTVPICVGARTNTGTLTAGGSGATAVAFILVEYA